MRRMSKREKYFSLQSAKGFLAFLFKAVPMFILSIIVKEKEQYQELWIITERPDEARDNGYHLFKYIRINHNERNTFYVIDKNSNDLPKVLKYQNVVFFGTYRHYLYYFLSTRHITAISQGTGCMPNVYACHLIELMFSLKAKKVYLKHGIVKDYIDRLTKDRSGLDLVVCGALPEYKDIKANYGYSENEVQYLGLARFDELNKPIKSKKQIMYMPTWRTWLSGADDSEFIESNYYKSIQSLLNRKTLHFLLEKYDMDFILCLHPVTQKYGKHFSSENKKLKILSTEKFDIQDLLKESALLITDYSSVFFDFAYMNKALIYYQFDYDLYRKKHYKQGYFNYHRDGFGPVVRKETKLLIKLEKMIINECYPSEQYLQRINSFFPIKDDNNCKRNYESILNL